MNPNKIIQANIKELKCHVCIIQKTFEHNLNGTFSNRVLSKLNTH